jgi:LuxR family transcriptional regulator, maltose regulon positive regulatory protein
VSITSLDAHRRSHAGRRAIASRLGLPLIEAKLQPPSERPGLVRRDALIGLLDETDASVVAIVAPPGYGKTTLLTQWAASAERRVAWLTIDDRDNDASVFVTYLAAALDRVEPLTLPVVASLSAPGRRALSTAVPQLISAIHAWHEPTVMVVDDVHRLTDRTCLDALAEVIDYLPEGVRVVAAARSEPSLPLARLRVAGRLLEIGPAELAFGEPETGAAASAVGRRLEAEAVHALQGRTEGWPAGVYLATLRPRGSDGSDRAIEVSGGQPHVADYFRDELLGPLDDGDVRLLTRTSILESIDAGVADAVVGEPGSARRLRELARRHLFIVPIGADASSHRYHTLLREFLLEELEQREPGLRPELHRRAAAWYAANGQTTLAVEHGFASGDSDLAAVHATAAALPTFYAGNWTTVDRWFARLDDTAFLRHPELAVISAWINALSGRAAEADRMADLAERVDVRGWTPDTVAAFGSSLAQLRAVMCRRGLDDALVNARAAIDYEPPGSRWRANALYLYGGVSLLLGDEESADTAFVEAVAASTMSGATSMVASATRASLAIRRGDWAAAGRHAGAGLRALEAGDYGELAAALLVRATRARCEIHRGDHAAARAELARAQAIRPLASHALPWFSVQCLVELGRAYLALGDGSGAGQVVREAEAIARVRPSIGTLTSELADLRSQVEHRGAGISGASSLTAAELRLLPLLPTYLSMQEIADRFFVSRHTVRTQVASLYGKLGVSSRGAAVEEAIRLGLIDPIPVLEPAAGRGRADDPD